MTPTLKLPIRPKLKITITLPEPEPEPPDQVCELCGREEPHWLMLIMKPRPICINCAADGRSLLAVGDYRDNRIMAAAQAVTKRLETDRGS